MILVNFRHYIPLPHSPLTPFKHQPHKMVKLIQTMTQLLLTNCLSVFDHFLGLVLKGLTVYFLSFFSFFFLTFLFIANADGS